MSAAGIDPTLALAAEVVDERRRQDAKWGTQDHSDGTGGITDRGHSVLARRKCEAAFRAGIGTWRDILHEEVAEAFAEADPARLRAELIQVSAVASAWAEAIDRRLK